MRLISVDAHNSSSFILTANYYNSYEWAFTLFFNFCYNKQCYKELSCTCLLIYILELLQSIVLKKQFYSVFFLFKNSFPLVNNLYYSITVFPYLADESDWRYPYDAFCGERLNSVLNSVLQIPWRSSGLDSMFSLPRAWVQSLVRELRSCQLHGTAKNKKQNKFCFKSSQNTWLAKTFDAKSNTSH